MVGLLIQKVCDRSLGSGRPPVGDRSLENSLREAAAMHDQYIGVEHLALGLIGMDGGLVPQILQALGASGPALRAAILGRYRQAS
jgi:ATP-dependent Clp protease ATP-binding subunit ClpA